MNILKYLAILLIVFVLFGCTAKDKLENYKDYICGLTPEQLEEFKEHTTLSDAEIESVLEMCDEEEIVEEQEPEGELSEEEQLQEEETEEPIEPEEEESQEEPEEDPHSDCTSNSNCESDEYCAPLAYGDFCTKITQGDCGSISNHQWVEYECCSNSDCSNNEQCVDHSCELVAGTCGYTENHEWISYECCSDNVCEGNEYCNNNACVAVESDSCGYLSNHAWINYECCENEDCEENYECIDHFCNEIEQEEPEEDEYILHENIYATFFWAGEEASGDNSYIPNDVSAWDEDWELHYGGYDDPDCRNGYYPCGFTPGENPFYFAIPYNDFSDEGERKANAQQIPWYYDAPWDVSLMKNRWIEITYEGTTCYAQQEDTGPYNEDDFDYVFNGGSPTYSVGIDLSPAMKTCLEMPDNGYVDWKFIDYENVPQGPWKEIVTTSQVNWH